MVAGTRQARLPVRAAELRGLRVLVTLSPLNSLVGDDRAVLDGVLAERRLRLVGPEVDLEAFLAVRGLDTLRFEGPPGVYLFPRRAAAGNTIIHLVNWNLLPDQDRPQGFRFVTVSLPRWGAIGKATYWQPGTAPVGVEPEVHPDAVRLTLPKLDTWGILELTPQ